MGLFNVTKKLYAKDLGSVSVIIPHDDDIIGCAGAVYHAHLKGIPVSLIVMTNGELGYFDANQKDSIVKEREEDAKNAYKLLGINDVEFLGFPDMNLYNYKRDASLKLIEALRKRKSKTVLFTTKEDHLDHESTCMISRHVLFTQVGYSHLPDLGEPAEIENVFEYCVWSKLEKPTHYFKLTKETQKIKEDLLQTFGTQKEFLEKLGIDFKIEKYKLTSQA